MCVTVNCGHTYRRVQHPPNTQGNLLSAHSGEILYPPMKQLDVLEALAQGDIAAAIEVAEAGNLRQVIIDAAQGRPEAVTALAADPDRLAQAFASPVGPLLASPLARTISGNGRLSLLPELVVTLSGAPLSPGPLLNKLLELVIDDPRGVAAASAHLDALYQALPDDLPSSLADALALPRALGLTWDVHLLCTETGALDLVPGPAPINVLRVALDQADAVSVLELLPTGDRVEQVTVDPEVIATSALAAFSVQAYATGARLAILAILVSGSQGENSAAVGQARELLMDAMAKTTEGGRSLLLMRSEFRSLITTLP